MGTKFNPTGDYGSNSAPKEQRSFHIPPGTYQVSVEDVELRQPKDPTKSEYFNIRMRVAKGKHKGNTIWDIISTGQRSFWKLRDFCNAFDFADVIGDIELPEQADIIITKAKGTSGWVETRVEEMNNKKLKTQVAKYLVRDNGIKEETKPAPTPEPFEDEDDIPF